MPGVDAQLPDLPIVAALPALSAALATIMRVIVEAPPGAGKSTLVPLHLLDADWTRGQRIVLLEPRRVAARAVAARMATLLGQPLGATVGFRTRLERVIGPHTRIEVITEGILTRTLQSDPSLEGIACVIFDEFHERSLQADLGLALCLDAQEHLRPDLRLLVMSATLDGERLTELLRESATGARDGAPAHGRDPLDRAGATPARPRRAARTARRGRGCRGAFTPRGRCAGIPAGRCGHTPRRRASRDWSAGGRRRAAVVWRTGRSGPGCRIASGTTRPAQADPGNQPR
jgi:hypothetical protein